jgi:oxygen-dependent protoporphyrinogen oxidase
VGGGVAGLSAALALGDAGVSFRLLESGTEWGGVIRTHLEEGFLLDAGPDSLLTAKPEAVNLCTRLNLGSRLVPTNPIHRRIYFLQAGKLHPLPDGMFLAVPTQVGPFLKSPLFSWPGKLRIGLDFLERKRIGPDESITAFIARHFGREAVEKLGEPLLAGIHAGDPDFLSIQATFPRFVDLERRYGSLILGTWLSTRGRKSGAQPAAPFVSLLGGLGELVQGLVAAIPEPNRSLGCPVLSLSHANGWHRAELPGGRSVEARRIILAIPAPRSATVLDALDSRTAARLRDLRFVSSATVFLGYPKERVRHALDGYGLLVPRAAGLRTTACTFVSTKLPGRAPEGKVLLRGFFGGARDPGALQMSDADLVRTLQSEMGPVLGFDGEPGLSRVYRWVDATPQLAVGHEDWIQGVEKGLPAGLFLAGAGYRATGIPDSIGDGQKAAARAIASLN